MSAQEDRTGQTLRFWLRTFVSSKRIAELAFVLVIRGWLIERARTKKARRAAEFWRDAYVGLDMAKSHEPGGYDSRLPWEVDG